MNIYDIIWHLFGCDLLLMVDGLGVFYYNRNTVFT